MPAGRPAGLWSVPDESNISALNPSGHTQIPIRRINWQAVVESNYYAFRYLETTQIPSGLLFGAAEGNRTLLSLADNELNSQSPTTAYIWCPHFDSNEVFNRTKVAHHHICFAGVIVWCSYFDSNEVSSLTKAVHHRICFRSDVWYRWRDSNSQSNKRRQILSLMCIPFHHIGINWGPLIGQRLCAPISRSWTYSDAFGNPCQNQTDAVEFKARPSIIKCKGQLLFAVTLAMTSTVSIATRIINSFHLASDLVETNNWNVAVVATTLTILVSNGNASIDNEFVSHCILL